MHGFRLSLLAIGVALFFAPAHGRAQAPVYQGISDGFDFPADKAVLELERKTGNMAAQRRHAWMLYAGMTQTGPDGTPHWATWYRVDEASAPLRSRPQSARRLVMRFLKPNQQKDPGPLDLQQPRDSALSFVLFNWENFDHIRAKRLFLKRTLKRINRSYRASTPWDQRIIQPFPVRAVSLKTLWWPAAGDAKTPLPVWDNEPTQPLEERNSFKSWKRVVAVDVMRAQAPNAEFADITFLGKAFPSARVVGLNRFYAVRVDAALIDLLAQNKDDGIRILVKNVLGRDLKVGDYILFLGFHVTTKEIDDWTWQTFWWHDRPNEGPYAAGRPDAVIGVWRNYLMAVANDEVTPKEPDGSPLIAFNPWLEGSFRAGTQSNCMNCHRRASYPKIPFLPVRRGAPDLVSDPAYKPHRLQTDFLWTIVDKAR